MLVRAKLESFKGALVLAVHHHPYRAHQALGNARSPSEQMRAEMDNIFRQAGVWPHAVLSGHSHNYQRFTRTVGSIQIPYIVAGAGGHSVAPLRLGDKVRVPKALTSSSAAGERTVLEAYYDQDFSYLRITVDARQLLIECQPVGQKRPQDSVTVDLQTYKIVA